MTAAATPSWTIADSATKNNEDGSKSLILTLRATKTLASGATLHVGQFSYELANPTSDDLANYVNKAEVVLSIAPAPAAAAAATAATPSSSTAKSS